jgi:hypothetical protein
MDGCVARHMVAKVPAFETIVPAPDSHSDQRRNPAYVIAAPAQLDAGTCVSGPATPNRRARRARGRGTRRRVDDRRGRIAAEKPYA